jgi:hypothetical protein
VSFYMSYNFLSFTHSSYTDLQIFQWWIWTGWYMCNLWPVSGMCVIYRIC